MKTLSMIAQKGGTGKTTLSIHLAVQASLAGLKVLLVDIDPQASATAWWRRRREEKPALVQSNGDALGKVLRTAADQRYDLAVVDTAPHSSHEATTCAHLSDQVCIPTRPAILDLDAIGASTELVSDIGVPARRRPCSASRTLCPRRAMPSVSTAFQCATCLSVSVQRWDMRSSTDGRSPSLSVRVRRRGRLTVCGKH